MEPLDPAKNDEGSGFSKRRISSILKAPRKSVHFPEPKQPEKVVECVKPVDKRNSRRVSFAPANDVLLFSKDVKSASPVRSPLQELITTATATQNGVQVEVTEDGIQQSMGMETLLNAPLHASQQRNKADFDSGHVFGEKTVMFSTDDAFMDMTQSHTINIADDADISIQNSFTTRGEKRVLTVNSGAMDITLSHNGNIGSVPTSGNVDLRVEKGNISSSALTLDPGFENFLASLSKPRDPSVNPVITTMTSAASTERTNCSLGQIKPHRADVSKENQPPTSVSAVMEKSLSTSRKICELSYGKAVWPEEDLSMDMTEAQTGRIVGFSDDDDPFQCLFPTQEMYSRLDSRMSQTKEKTKQQQISKPQASLNPTDMTSLKNPSLQDFNQRHKDKLHTADKCREKTIIFTAGDEIVDMTQSHTIKMNIDSFAPSNQNVDIFLTSGKINYASSLEERKRETCGTPGLSAKGLDLGFKNVLSSLSTTVAPSGRPVIATMVPSTAASSLETVDTSGSLSQLKSTVGKENHSLITRVSGESFNGGTICPENDASMNLTGGILGLTGSDDPFQFIFPTKDMYPKGSLQKQEITSRQQHNEVPASSNRKGMGTSLTASLKTKVQKHQVKIDAEDDCREKTVRFTADDACMDVTKSHTVNIEPYLQPQSHQNVDFFPACGEKTVRFTADDAAMDVTKSHTVNIEPYLQLQSHQNVDFFPACGEKTVGFTADDACMDVTKSHTVNIEPYLQPQSHQNVDFLPACGEKTVRFTADDAAMDVTKSHTVNIEPYLQLQSHQNVDFFPACGEKTVRFTADDACMDVTKSHTVNIEPYLQLQSHQNVDILPACGEKTVRFTADDAAMDVTQALTVKFDHNSASDSHPQRYSDISSTHENMNFPLSAEKTHLHRRNRSLSAYALNPGFRNSLAKMSGPRANPVITRPAALTALSPQKTEDTYSILDQVKTRKPDVETEKEAFVSSAVKKPINKTMMEGPEPDVSMKMNEAQTCCVSGQTDDRCPPSTLDLCPYSDYLKEAEVTSQLSGEALGSSNPDCVEITNLPDSLHSNETVTDCKPRNPTLTLSEEMENSPSAVNHDVDAAPSRKSRRISLVDLQSKVRGLSHIINTAPVTIAMEACTAPLPRLERDLDNNSKDETKCPPLTEPDLVMGLVNTEENAQDQSHMEGEQPFTTSIPTPFILKTKQFMSRLSVGSFKAKLPQRGNDPKKQTSVGEPTRTATVNVTNKLSNFDNDFSNIFDEELASCEDMSETLDMSASHVLEDDVFEEDFVSSVHGKKRPLPADENNMEDEKRMKASPEAPTDVETSHVAESLQTTQTTDYSNSIHTARTRREATLESTFKQSVFESQLEDYTNDLQRKLNDGNITVSEFFKLFNIDFVIHNPRQSILPGRCLSDTDRTPMDLLKDRHIYYPKQMVYERDVLNLTEHVEGLKGRMQDLDKPLKIVNGPLWEEVRNYSEKELKSFGAKLKERNNLFRKLSKVQSHEMKEVLYSNIVQASLEEQQRLRGTIGEADEMLKSLDDCIHELETELTAVEEKGFEDKPSLKSRQEEMQKVAEALEDNDRRISELELQKKQNSNKLNRLKAETRNLESHVNVLHRVNEWRFAEKTDNCTSYTFLYESLHLELVYEESSGNDAGNQSERKISHITFKFQLDDEKSWGHACLVHKLLSEYTKGEGDWVEKYPTSRHVPALLHDVGLVVSRCRLLGEELRLLKMWGGLKLDILNISCVDTRVHIVFSSLETCSKFEVIFSVSLIDRLYVLQLHSFKNMIGNVTIQQIEEIVASFSPAKNLLTKIVKSIHENLLC